MASTAISATNGIAERRKIEKSERIQIVRKQVPQRTIEWIRHVTSAVNRVTEVQAVLYSEANTKGQKVTEVREMG